MIEFLLIVIGVAQLIQIIVTLMLLRAIDKPDFSQEDAQVKEATDAVNAAQKNLPPQN